MNILRYPDVARKCGVSRMTIWRWATQPEYADMGFPRQLDLGANSVGFVESEIDDFLTSRAANRDGAPRAARATKESQRA